MNDEVIYGYNEDCTKDVSFYDIIQSLSIEDDLKEQLLKKVRDLNELNSELKHELNSELKCELNSELKHELDRYHSEVKNLKKVIFSLL